MNSAQMIAKSFLPKICRRKLFPFSFTHTGIIVRRTLGKRPAKSSYCLVLRIGIHIDDMHTILYHPCLMHGFFPHFSGTVICDNLSDLTHL